MGFSPILVSLWIVKTIQNWNDLYFYIKADSWKDAYAGTINLLRNHYLVLIFIVILLTTRFLIKKAEHTLSIGAIDVKSIKPSDNNFLTFLFSIILPFFKFYVTGISDFTFLIGFIIICIVYAIVLNRSYHFNLMLRFFFGYNNYEVQSKKEITYLVLSKSILINPSQLTHYIQLTDFMLINSSNKANYD